MKEEKIKDDEVAITLACLVGQMESDNYADSFYRSAEVYQELTGEKMFEHFLNETPKKKKWWQFWS